eukprot:CAMPEP_0198268970 /NCGR_PEP_ID=MMETSP1447-20131203/39546_1 /TAXON_ID=420782 /ORGANISM="Chaetoceros dichaeta, Strain CCMP1751" /LENGTH=39 /DNA_ID= /DNA_START= /DNA_END= /DNA_ORIENTATION=
MGGGSRAGDPGGSEGGGLLVWLGKMVESCAIIGADWYEW